jgi:hypothetical protein
MRTEGDSGFSAGCDFGVKIGFPTELAGKRKNLCSCGAIVNRK